MSSEIRPAYSIPDIMARHDAPGSVARRVVDRLGVACRIGRNRAIPAEAMERVEIGMIAAGYPVREPELATSA